MQIESSTKFRGGWENKDNQEHYQPAPGVQALGARGEYMLGGEGQPPPLHPEAVSIFICEIARSLSLELLRILEDGAQVHLRMEESGS